MSTSGGPNILKQLIKRQTESNFRSFQPTLYRERLKIAKNLYKYDLISHYGCVNAIEFSKGGEFLISGGDDKRVLLWNVEKSIAGYQQPRCMCKEHQSNIFCLGFNTDNTKIFSGGNDDLVIVHDTETGKVVDVYIHVKPVYGLSVDPICDSIIATAGEDGRIILFDQRKGDAVMSLGKYRAPFHAVQFHPLDGDFLVTANSKKGAAFWDIRKSTSPLVQYGGENNQQSCMSVRFNSNGNQVLALRQRLPPILYNTFSDKAVCQFYHPDYYNSCTMKSCCFAGEDDEFVLSGSDDFNLYVWRVGDVDLELTDQWIEQTQMVLYGHRSIVNQVRFNPEKCILASSGVEKIVKLWSPFEQKGWTGGLVEEASGPENPREVFSQHDYFSLVQMNWSNMTHDYSNQNTNEDPRMLAFFDSLIQQEIEGWNTNCTTDSDQCTDVSSENSTRQSSTEDSDEDDLVNYFVHQKDRHRRGGKTNTVKPQRNKYANRIAYLIATKRNTLRRLALKGASQSNRKRQASIKTNKRKGHNQNHRNSVRTSRSGTSGKRLGRFTALSSRTRSRDEAENQKIPRFKGHSLFRSFRRKIRNYRALDLSDSSSDDDIDSPTDPEGGTHANNLPGSSTNIAIPSTSTGITSNGQDYVFRLRQQQQQQDSDDNSATNSETEGNPQTGQNTAKKIQLNGVNHTNTTPTANNNNNNNSTHLSSDIDEDRYLSPTNRRKRRATPAANLDIYSSHSNSRLSNSSYLEDEHDSTSNESLDCFSKKRKSVPNNNNNTINNNNINNNNHECFSHNGDTCTSLTEVKTPNNGNVKNNNCSTTPDSGINLATPGCSSSSTSHTNNNNHNNNNITHNCCNGETSCNEDKFAIKLIFEHKVARVRRNYRKKFGVKSDSD